MHANILKACNKFTKLKLNDLHVVVIIIVVRMKSASLHTTAKMNLLQL